VHSLGAAKKIDCVILSRVLSKEILTDRKQLNSPHYLVKRGAEVDTPGHRALRDAPGGASH